MGVSFEAATPKHAVVHCNGTCQNTKYAIDYEGPQTCAACNTMFGGRGTCNFGCIGFGDCVAACQYDAIHLVNGVAVVDPENCVACGACAKACPKGLITMIPETSQIYVSCSSQAKGAVTRQACSVGCIACRKCEKNCPAGAITVSNNVASIDPEKCTNCGLCMSQCPTGAIRNVMYCDGNPANTAAHD